MNDLTEKYEAFMLVLRDHMALAQSLAEREEVLRQRKEALDARNRDIETKEATLRGERDQFDQERKYVVKKLADIETKEREIDVKVNDMATRERQVREAEVRIQTASKTLEVVEARIKELEGMEVETTRIEGLKKAVDVQSRENKLISDKLDEREFKLHKEREAFQKLIDQYNKKTKTQ